MKSTKITTDEKNEIVKFEFAHCKELTEKGACIELHVEFIGELNNKMIGFYRSSYINRTGEKG
jgi:aminopeptidase 2